MSSEPRSRMYRTQFFQVIQVIQKYPSKNVLAKCWKGSQLSERSKGPENQNSSLLQRLGVILVGHSEDKLGQHRGQHGAGVEATLLSINRELTRFEASCYRLMSESVPVFSRR